MIEKTYIDAQLKLVFEIMEKFQLNIIKLQGKAAKKAITKAQAKAINAELVKAQTKMSVLAKSTNNRLAKEFVPVFNEIIKKDMAMQMAVYNKGFDKGKIKTKPKVPGIVKMGVVRNANKTYALMAQNNLRVAKYGGKKLAKIVHGAVSQAVKGVDKLAIERDAAARIAEEGISIKYASGREVHDLIAYSRQQVVSGVNAAALEEQVGIFDAIDAKEKWYETSAHMGARPEHAEWQGKIFKSWDEFVSATGYGEVDGLGGVNCRHTFYPFIPGVSEQLFKPFNLKSNESVYEDIQEQRRIEGNIRKWKVREAANDGLGVDDNGLSGGKVREWQEKMRAHISDTGIKRNYDREQI